MKDIPHLQGGIFFPCGHAYVKNRQLLALPSSLYEQLSLASFPSSTLHLHRCFARIALSKKIMFKHIITLLLVCGLCPQLEAQVTPHLRDSLLQQLAIKLEEQYVFPDKGANAAKAIRQYQKDKRYQAIQTPEAMAAKLTADLQSLLHDKHIRIGYSEQEQPLGEEVQMEIPESEKAQYAEYLRHDNYGIGKVEVLKGNIGYLDFKYLCTPEFAGDSYAAIMNYIATTDALIIDLRRCGGSTSPDAIPFIASYLFDKPTHLNDLYWRKGNVTQQQWTYAHVPGKRFLQKPVYVLTSKATFSGAEELAYDLQNLKRAILIGDVTGGGANGGGDIRLTRHFSVFMPSGRAINPITKTNWEGTGVTPDSLMAAPKALHAATVLALDTILKTTRDEGYRQYLTGVFAEVKKNAPVFVPVQFELPGFEGAKQVFVAGTFNGWSAESLKMERKGNRWLAIAEAEPGRMEYKFVVDGQWMQDPHNKNKEAEDNNANSVKWVQRSF